MAGSLRPRGTEDSTKQTLNLRLNLISKLTTERVLRLRIPKEELPSSTHTYTTTTPPVYTCSSPPPSPPSTYTSQFSYTACNTTFLYSAVLTLTFCIVLL